jgi:predicted phosphohydrolase
MKIFALSDPHLSLATPNKSMTIFGSHWVDHAAKISRAWKDRVGEEDVVLVAGDVSWAMRLSEAAADLAFLAQLPGRKVLIRGNHDYWWGSATKVRSLLPAGMYILHNDALFLDGVALAGTRLWIDPDMAPPRLPQRTEQDGLPVRSNRNKDEWNSESIDPERDQRIFERELGRLELALSRLSDQAPLRIAMVHFPPLSNDLKETRAARMLEEAGIHHCVFGHLHNVLPGPGRSFYGCRKGVVYHLTSCDYLDFVPDLVGEV